MGLKKMMQVAALAVLTLVGSLLTLSPLWMLSKPQSQPVAQPQPLLEYTERAIDLANPKLSPVRKKLIAKLVTGIAEQTFQDRLHQELWITLLRVESRYQGSAKSHVGATGIGQLMPQYRADFGKTCGLTELDATDLADDYTNATLSACFFKELIERNEGNVPLALVSYNAGAYSTALKNIKQGASANHETANYVAKIWVNHTSQQETK